MPRLFALGSLCVACLAVPAAAEVTPAPIFGDHMVLQSGRPVPVFGATEPGGTVNLTCSVIERSEGDAEEPIARAKTAQTVTADDAGRWQVEIGPFEPGQELRFVLVDADEANDEAARTVISDVLVGDVWLCSGQSNMAWGLNRTLDAQREIESANDEQIRLFTVPRHAAREPQFGLKDEGKDGEPSSGRWVKLSPAAARRFSAVGYYFGTTLHDAIDQPVGLIHSSWGGTPSEAWTRPAALESIESAAELLASWERGEPLYKDRAQHRPGALNNGMIAPLVPFALKGAIWYQGEANSGRPEQYDEIFPAMIEDWRAQFDQELPFFWVQLANFMQYQENPNRNSSWAKLREAQDNTLDELENVGQAVIIDVGEARSIHPMNKKDVGERLALAALKTLYGRTDPGMLSPRFEEAKIEGTTATITFDVDGDSLQVRRDESVGADVAEGNEALGFAVAGPERAFYWAKAQVTGPNTVTVTAPAEVSEIVAIRYAWNDNPRITLFNTRGLPAAPFRTDDWEKTLNKRR